MNSLYNSPELSFQKEQILEALEMMGLSGNIRGEALTLKQFAELSNLLDRISLKFASKN